MSLTYFLGDERPAWQPTITVDGSSEDYSSGYTFTCEVFDDSGTSQFVKTSGITGGSGTVTVDWAATSELSTLSVGNYIARLRVRRDADNKDFTLQTELRVKAGLS